MSKNCMFVLTTEVYIVNAVIARCRRPYKQDLSYLHDSGRIYVCIVCVFMQAYNNSADLRVKNKVNPV